MSICLLPCLPMNATILLNDVMNKDLQKRTGVADLSYKQRLALEQWLNDTFVLKNDNEEKSEKKEIYLSQNINGGQQLELSDGSRWEVAPADVSRASFWLIPFPLKIVQNEDPKDNAQYPSVIINQNTGVGVKVRMTSPPEKIYPKEP